MHAWCTRTAVIVTALTLMPWTTMAADKSTKTSGHTATVSATAIQLWFRVQAKRSQFRRRQTSSRIATFAEAFSSIGWAATAALALVAPLPAVISGLLTAAIMAVTWKISPRRE